MDDFTVSCLVTPDGMSVFRWSAMCKSSQSGSMYIQEYSISFSGYGYLHLLIRPFSQNNSELARWEFASIFFIQLS